ncbi:isochorismate synthase MenF [Macrococcoides canis]|uniref:isochorismate synthase n=1 Tax=Macrococcoides canis TaxID=1855823 RepID=UPI0020B6E682|nr:isochorismate synthase [Macrococcus canis]UTG99593.1 isochorismate synthase [Macrococcus canis]WBF53404.1 isochorismate synthase [Macrococcus canis]
MPVELTLKAIYQFPYEGVTQEAAIFRHFADYKGERYLYINKDKSLKIIGIGVQSLIAHSTIDPEGVEAAFHNQLADAQVHGDRKLHLKLFGGFYFDEAESTDFDTFSRSHFVIPKIQIIIEEGASWIIFTDAALDRERICSELMSLPSVDVQHNALIHSEDIELETFKTNATEAIQQMQQGAFDKVVLSRKRQLTMTSPIEVEALIDVASRNHELSYTMVMESGHKTFISKTPEQLVAVMDGVIYTNAIAGTMPKTVTDAKALLQSDEKNLHEHHIVVQSIEQDLAPFSQNIIMKDDPEILENQFLYHLYTPIKAKLNNGSTLRVTRALHPTPALGGYPKSEAMAFLESSGEHRGLYGAPVGYIDAQGDGEFIVAIRSMVIEENRALLFAGCGIVEDSEVESEVYETEIKFKPMLQMLGVPQHE